MKVVLDNQIVKLLAHETDIAKNPLLSNPDNQVSFGWSNLLEYLTLGSLLSNLPLFDETQPLFIACISALHANEEKEVLFYVYDQLFAENLNQIKALPQINASFLLQALKERPLNALLSPTLIEKEIALLNRTSDTMHDLILYLAWDRMCVSLSRLFNYQSTDPLFIKGLDVLKECLIESYQHISQQGRTVPSIYRMMEALFFYQMRDENLQKHTDAEWTLLSQSFPVLKDQNELADFFYIDDAVISKEEAVYLTLDSPKDVQTRLALATYMIDKLKTDVLSWNYALQPKKIVYL